MAVADVVHLGERGARARRKEESAAATRGGGMFSPAAARIGERRGRPTAGTRGRRRRRRARAPARAARGSGRGTAAVALVELRSRLPPSAARRSSSGGTPSARACPSRSVVQAEEAELVVELRAAFLRAARSACRRGRAPRCAPSSRARSAARRGRGRARPRTRARRRRLQSRRALLPLLRVERRLGRAPRRGRRVGRGSRRLGDAARAHERLERDRDAHVARERVRLVGHGPPPLVAALAARSPVVGAPYPRRAAASASAARYGMTG